MGLGIYIFGFVCLRWWFFCLLWWFDGYLKSGMKVDRFGGFWVSGIDLGVSEGHMRIKGWEPKWHG